MFNNYKILYSEDDEFTSNNMYEMFNIMFKHVYTAKNGQEALELYNEKAPDIIILDIEMPHMSGIEVAKKIRETNPHVPIVFATAYTETRYFLQAVELNITTYLIKPINMVDLQEALKKCKKKLTYEKNTVINITEEINYNIEEHSLYVKEEHIHLTKNEMLFLEYMLKYPNQVISYEEFENNIWYDIGMTGGAIRSLVRDLRKYIGKDTIKNISGVGYKLIIA